MASAALLKPRRLGSFQGRDDSDLGNSKSQYLDLKSFQDHNVQQSRSGLTKLDLRKIEIVYGPECTTRDRREKLELCQSYPGVARKKRDTGPAVDNDMSSRRPEFDRKKRDAAVTKSLRVNPEITPPPNAVKDTLTDLGIDEAVQNIVEEVYKISALALKNAREKYCNNTKPSLRTVDIKDRERTDILGIIEVIANFAQGMVDNAVANLTKFCEESESIDVYQRARCGWNDGSDRCRHSYRSTKSGAVKYSTQHRPVYIQSTNHRQIGYAKHIYDPMLRSSNNTDENTETTASERRKRETDDAKGSGELKEGSDKKVGLENKPNKGNETEGERAENKTEDKQVEVKNGEDKVDDKVNDTLLLRSGTTVPAFKVNRYEPIRRQARRSR